jgi:transposase-like protein
LFAQVKQQAVGLMSDEHFTVDGTLIEGLCCKHDWADLVRYIVTRRRPALFRGRHFEDVIILLCVRWYLRYSLTYRDLEELMAERNLSIDYVTIWRWVQRYAPVLNQRLRREMRRPNGSWRVDETYVKVAGSWAYLYRAVDSAGETIEFMLSPKRDLIAAGSGANEPAVGDDGQMPRFVPVEELFKGRHFNQEIVILCVRWYLSFRLSLRDLVAMMAERGIGIAHTTILRWGQHYTPEFEKRWKRFARSVGGSWRMDETYVRVKGEWVYLYRAVDKSGKTVDFYLSRSAT